MKMDKYDVFEELETLNECQAAVIELLSVLPNGIARTGNLAVLLNYLHSKRVELTDMVKRL